MTDADKIDLLLDDYLAGRLDPSAKAKLETELAHDEKLQQSLALHKAANVLIREHKLKDITAIAQKVQKEESSFWNTYGFWIGGGLGAVLGFVLLFTALNQANETKLNPNTHTVATQEPVVAKQEKGTVASAEAEEQLILNKITSPKNSGSGKSSNKKIGDEGVQAGSPWTTLETKSNEISSTSSSETIVASTKNTNEKDASNVTMPTSHPCEQVVIEAEIHTSPTCADGATGKIEVKSIKGGAAPYHIDYFDSHGHAIHPTEHWGKGSYQVKIKDAHGCLSPMFTAIVKETICKEDVSFNPYVGEGWEGAGFGQEATIRVFDRNHGVIYEKRIPKGEHHLWDGRNTKGDLAEGYFLFEITFADGGKKTGSVTVVR